MFTEQDVIRAFVCGAKWHARYHEKRHVLPLRMEVEHAAEQHARLVSEQPAPAPKRNGKKPKEEKPTGWSDAAWERYLTVRSASTYAALDNDAISRRTMSALDKKEELRPPVRFHARFSFHSTQPQRTGRRAEMKPGPANEALVQLAKMGVPADALHVETQEEHERQELLEEYRRAKYCARVVLPVERPYASRIDPYLSHFFNARTVVVKLLEKGLREEARDLLSTVRGNERAVLGRFGTLESSLGVDRFGILYTRAGHRAKRLQKRAAVAEMGREEP